MLHLVWGLCAFVTKGLLTRHLCERSMWKNSSNWLCVNWAHYWSAFCFSCDSNLNRSNYLKSVRPNAAFLIDSSISYSNTFWASLLASELGQIPNNQINIQIKYNILSIWKYLVKYYLRNIIWYLVKYLNT